MATEKTAWLLTEEAVAWRKTLDAAVAGGTIQPALRDAVLNPGVPFELHGSRPAQEYPLTPDTWSAATKGWNAAVNAIRSYVSLNSNRHMTMDQLAQDLERMKL